MLFRSFVTIKTKNKELVYRGTLNDLSYKLRSKNFLRTHKSYLVNVDKIDAIVKCNNNSYNITFKNMTDKAYMTRTSYSEYKKTF